MLQFHAKLARTVIPLDFYCQLAIALLDTIVLMRKYSLPWLMSLMVKLPVLTINHLIVSEVPSLVLKTYVLLVTTAPLVQM